MRLLYVFCFHSLFIVQYILNIQVKIEDLFSCLYSRKYSFGSSINKVNILSKYCFENVF